MQKYLLLLLLLHYGCKKDEGSHPIDTSNTKITKLDPIDSVSGVYIGMVMHINEYKRAGPPPADIVPHYDTSYWIDTIYIDKITADTFSIVNADWFTTELLIYCGNGRFKYSGGNIYNIAYAGVNFGGGMQIIFTPTADSLFISRGRVSWYSK